MRVPSVFAKFLLAATSIAEIAGSRTFAQEPTPSTKIELSLPDAANAGGVAPAVPAAAPDAARRGTLSNFMLVFANPISVAGTNERYRSVAPTDILNLQYSFTPVLTGEFAVRTDWVYQKPGFFTSAQYAGVQLLDMQVKLKDTTLKFGTLFIWTPELGDPRTEGKPAILDSFFIFGGGFPGLGGVRVDSTLSGSGVTVKYSVMAGTGLRGLDSNLTGAKEPSDCQGVNQEGCGVVVGGNLDLQAKALPGATFNTQVTRVGNGNGENNELRSTFGARYTHEVGAGITLTGAGETTHGTHYFGGSPNLDVTTAKITAEKKLSSTFSVQGYTSGLGTRGAINEEFVTNGATVTYQKHNNMFSVEAYKGTMDKQGVIFRWGKTITFDHHSVPH